ncbi:MAG: histidine kinase [Clostridia bacterium]|nr:histidine kinase [Clostridia bacterium]
MDTGSPRPRRAGRITGVFASLRVQIILILLACYLIPSLALSIFIQGTLIPGLKEQTASALTADAEHAWNLTCQNIDSVISLSREAVYDGELADTYASRVSGRMTDDEFLRLSRSYIDRKYSRNGLFTFAAYFPAAEPELFMYTRSGYNEAILFMEKALEETLSLGGSLDTGTRFLESGEKLYLVRNLMDLKMERYGMLVLGVRRDVLLSPLEALADTWEGRVLIRLDGVWDEGPYPEGMSEKDGDVLYFRRSAGEDHGLSFLLKVPRAQQYREIYQFQYLALGLYLLLVPVLILLAWYVGRRIVKPISLLSGASRRIENGEWGVTVPMRGGDELGDLGVAFSSMSVHIKELIDRTYKEELELKNAQIQALQSRINPHFINNALEAINWQSRIEGSKTIPGMVSSLSVLLGAGMARQDRRIVPLREEMKVADAYIYFIQQRFGEDLKVERSLDESAMDWPVPLLTVQPVLENAVEHGIAPAGGGIISIICRNAGEYMRLEIVNTGRGITPEDRQKIDAALRGETDSGTHLGLANISSRLKLIYGGKAEIRVESGGDMRTAVRIDVPHSQI